MESEIEITGNSSVIKRTVGIKKWAPYFAVLWLLYGMNSIVAWFSFSPVIRIVATMVIIAASFLMRQHEVTKERRWIAILAFLYMVYATLKQDHLIAYLSVIISNIPFLCILFWPNDLLKRTYDVFRKVVIFFAIGSTIITVLSYVGLTAGIPHFELGPQSALHVNRGDFYNVYGIFPELNGIGFLFSRACGMMEEPGHFSIVLGFVYLIDRYTHRKINPAIIIGAIFTFSSTFFLMLLFTEFWNFIVNWKKAFLYLVCTIVMGLIVYKVLPRDMQDMVYYLAYERNMEKVVDAYDSSGSLEDALDERANNLGMRVYNQMSFEQKLVGDEGDRDIVLSDYRGFIVKMGFIGLGLIILISLTTLVSAPLLLKISLFLSLLMIMLHRAWFFYCSFPYFMSFIACSLYRFKLKTL